MSFMTSSFRLDDRENRNYALNELKDRIITHLGMNDISHNTWERFRDKFTEEVDDLYIKTSRHCLAFPINRFFAE